MKTIMTVVMSLAIAAGAETKTYVDLDIGDLLYNDVIKEKSLWMTDSRLWGGNAAGDANTDYRIRSYGSNKSGTIAVIECQYYTTGNGATFGGRSMTFGSVALGKDGGFNSRMQGGYVGFGNEGVCLERGQF